MTRAGEKRNRNTLLIIASTVAVSLAAWYVAFGWLVTTAFPGPTESLAEYPAYRGGFGPGYQFLPLTIPKNAADIAVQLHPGVLQAPTQIQLRVAWPDQNAFDSELQRLKTLDQTQAIRAEKAPNESMLLMASPYHNWSTPRLQWIVDLPQWLAQDPDRRVMLMHCDDPWHEQTGAVAVCPATLTMFYCAQFQ